jgi:hypothetical protein
MKYMKKNTVREVSSSNFLSFEAMKKPTSINNYVSDIASGHGIILDFHVETVVQFRPYPSVNSYILVASSLKI